MTMARMKIDLAMNGNRSTATLLRAWPHYCAHLLVTSDLSAPAHSYFLQHGSERDLARYGWSVLAEAPEDRIVIK
jgi:hypothetical protein